MFISCARAAVYRPLTAYANSADIQCKTHAGIMNANVKCLIFIILYKWEQREMRLAFFFFSCWQYGCCDIGVLTLHHRDVKEPVSPYLSCSSINFSRLRGAELLFWCLPRCYSRHETLNQVLQVRNDGRLTGFYDRRVFRWWFISAGWGMFFCCSALCESNTRSRGYLYDVEHAAHNLHLHTCFPWGQLRCKDAGEAATSLERQRQCFLVSPSVSQWFARIVDLCLLYTANNKPPSYKSSLKRLHSPVIVFVYLYRITHTGW